MRGIVVLTIILGSLPFCLMRPWIGVLVYSWISFMNPHRYAWGIAHTFPVALIVALVTIMGMLLTRDKSKVPKDGAVVIIVCLWILFVITTFFALNQAGAWERLNVVSKILLMTFVTLILINHPTKLRYLFLTIALSIGLLGLKGAIWVVMTGGTHRVYGPSGSFIYDNNDFALALNMILPMLLYLAKDEPRQWLRVLLRVCFVACIVSVVFTYSRGGFVAMAFVSFLLLLKARYKSLAFVMLVIGALGVMLIAPEKWTKRMDTIQTYEQDGSAQGRIMAWKTAWRIALDRPLIGGGFDTFTERVYARYSPESDDVKDVHSIYFEIIGEQGFIGLFLFLLLIASSYNTLRRLRHIISREADLQWAIHYPAMLQVSLVAYMVGGAFLGRAYFDLFYHLIASTVILRSLTVQALAVQRAQVPKPAPVPSVGGAVLWRPAAR